MIFNLFSYKANPKVSLCFNFNGFEKNTIYIVKGIKSFLYNFRNYFFSFLVSL